MVYTGPTVDVIASAASATWSVSVSALTAANTAVVKIREVNSNGWTYTAPVSFMVGDTALTPVVPLSTGDLAGLDRMVWQLVVTSPDGVQNFSGLLRVTDPGATIIQDPALAAFVTEVAAGGSYDGGVF